MLCHKPAMVCTAHDLFEWKDFPKGLKVLLLDKDVTYAAEIRLKLEGMDYVVSTFYHEDEALSAVLNKSKVFHVAIVEVSTIDYDGNFKFLRMAKGLPAIMIASNQCLSRTMKCIALGAIEVLNKPLSEDKLHNIWQHLVHKVYNAREGSTMVIPRLLNEQEHLDQLRVEVPCMSNDRCNHDQDRSSGNDKYPAPSTPQLKQVRLPDDAGCHDQTNWSTEKDSAEERYEESKSVETTCCNAAADMPIEAGQTMHDAPVKEEIDSADGCKSESDTSPHPRNGPETSLHGADAKTQPNASQTRGPFGPKINRKKMKVDWTSDLHKKFVQAVERLGVEQAIPSRILQLMKMEGLTRHNVASHLQKYRMQRRHALPKREERRIALRPKDAMQSNYYYQNKPIMTYPPPAYHSNQPVPGNQGYPMWVQPGGHTAASFQAWGGPSPAYQHWRWKSYPSLQADAWGCPVMPFLHGSYSHYPQNASVCYVGEATSGHIMSSISNDNHLADEVLDKIIKEAINKPWVPLPIGLKPPSMESVLVELSKQGISNIPPYSL